MYTKTNGIYKGYNILKSQIADGNTELQIMKAISITLYCTDAIKNFERTCIS